MALLRSALPGFVSGLVGLGLIAASPPGFDGWRPWQASALVLVGLSNAAQLPAMHFAAKALRWHANYETLELNRRIARVLRGTIPCSSAGLGLLLSSHLAEALRTPLGQHLALFWGAQLLLIARRRADRHERAFEHRRTEILYLVFGLGLLTSIHAVAVAGTPLGHGLSALFATLLACRLLLQVTIYRKVWPSALRLHSRALTLLFTLQVAVYGSYGFRFFAD